ncbi:MAG: gluconokinase [Woeseiaceae bacterium]
MVVIVCGVSGVGKTTIGERLAKNLGLPFFDADDFHSAANIKKMQGGSPLGEEDRQPWLEALANKLPDWQSNGGAVLACSALKESYRMMLETQCADRPLWVFLHAPEETIVERLSGRTSHFFDQRLLHSQLGELETPDYGWLIDARPSAEDIVNEILSRVRADQKASKSESRLMT